MHCNKSVVMPRGRAAASAAPAERRAACRMQRLLTLMSIIGTICTCSVAAEDRVELPRVPRVNASGSFGVFWSCGSALEFSSCTTLPNVTCSAVTKVGTFNSSITAASVHYNRAEVYMVFNQSEVRRLRLSSGDLDILYRAAPGLQLLCIAVDWLNQEFYLIQERRVLRCNLNATSCAEVLTDRATDVREIAVDPNNGWIFWTAGNGSVWRDALPTEGAAAVGNRSQPILLAAAGSSCPGRGFAVVSQLGSANLTVASGRTCNSSQSLNITSFSVKRTNPLSLAPGRSADAAQGFFTAAFDLATSGSSGLVCANANTCMWIDPRGGGSGRRLVVVDLAHSVMQFASLPTDVGADETGVCVALALWHRDLQFVPVPLMAPKNVEVVFTTVSADVTWDSPSSYGSGPAKLWPTSSRTIYESVWRNWMYKISVQASEVRAGSVLDGVALTLPELQVCLVQSRGSRRCHFDGLSSYWLYNISVTAYSSSGETSIVVRGSPLRDGSPVLIGATGGLAYVLLHVENGSVLAEGVAGSSAPYSASTMTDAQQSAIRDLAVAGSTRLFIVLGNRTVLQTDRSLLLSMLQSPAEVRPIAAAAAAVPATPPGLDSGSVRFDGCAATPQAEAVAWDWISGTLYVATATGIMRLAAGCSGRAEPVVAESAVAIVVEPLVEHLLLWITVDRRSLKYCKLGSRCQADDIATIYASPCNTTYLGQCVPEVLSVTVDVDAHVLYWTLKQSSEAKQLQLYAAALSQLTAYRELLGDSKPSTPSLVAHGGKILWINGSRLVVRDSRGDAIGSYPLTSPPPRTLWPLYNYSRWLLPGFADVDAMHAATRPRRIDTASSRVTVDGSATNFTIRWPYLNASTLVDVFYSVTINGTGISQSEVIYSVPAVNVATNTVVPLSPLRVTIVAFTHWVTGEPYTLDIPVPAAVPPAPNNLEAFVEYGSHSIIWLYWDQDYVPGAPVTNTTIFVTKLDNQSSSSSDLFVGAAFGSQRFFRLSSPGDGQEYSVMVVSCNAAGCSNFSTPITVCTAAGKLAPLPRLIVVQSSGLLLDSDYRFSESNVAKNVSPDNNVPVLLAAFVGDAGVSPVWVDSSGCLHQRLAEFGHVESQIGCELNQPGGAAVDNSRRRLYFLLNDSEVLQVDPVAMENRTVFHSSAGSIHAIAFDKYKRSLLLLMGEQQLIALDADNQTTQSAAGRLRVGRHVDSACNCTAASSSPKSYALAATVADGAIVFHLENGTVYRADTSLCNCWPIMRASDVNMPGFLPDQISAGDDRLFVYSKFKDGLLSSDFWGNKLMVLRNVSAQYIWPYGSFSDAALAVDFMPVVDRLTPLNANEVRVAWRCSSEAVCNVTAGTEREAFLLVWLRPSLPGQAVEVNSLKLSPGPYMMVSHLLSSATYSMQIWICNRESCAHSAVYNVTTLDAPTVPRLLEATNVSLTFSWTAPPDGSIWSHYIRLDSTSGKVEAKIPEVKTTPNRQYTMSVHDLTPATDYLARVVVKYKASSARDYQWPLSGVHVSTMCSPPADVTISKAECSRLANSTCTVALAYAEPSLIAKCQVSFNLSISCMSEDGDASVVLHRSSVVPMFVIPVADMAPADRRLRCIALALAISFSVSGPWSSPLELPLKPVSPDNISERSNESIAVPLAAGLSAVAGLAVTAAAIYIGVCRRRRRKNSQWLAKNRAGREDRRSPEGDSQNLPLVARRLVMPPVDMLVNDAYHTESVLHEPAAAPPSLVTASTAGSSHAKLPKVDRKKLVLLRPLGAGAFGEVFAGVTTLVNADDQEDNVPVAVKTLRSDASDTDKSDFLKEAVLMSNFHHKNVVRLIGVCAEADPIYIVIELMQEGDLLDFVRRKRPTREAAGQLSLHTLVHMSLDIASGCEYLESLHFVHRDLAARNCLVSSSGHVDCCPLVKIGDFGLARDVYRNDYYRKEGEAFLPVRWMSPESLVDGVFTNQSDVWSFGVLMWELFSLGMQPYTAKSNVEVLQYVRNAGTLDQPLRCPESMYRLMSQCWSYVPKERPSFMAVRCAVQQILSEVDQNAALVAAYDRCNGRLTSDQEFFSTSSAADDVPLSARMVRQLSDVFDADTKPSPAAAAAADERVQYRGQNSVKGRLSRIFRRSANASLLNRVNSQTDPDSRKSNIYVRSESVVSSDAVPLRVFSNSRDSAFMEADESHRGNFSDFILDSIATDQELPLPNAKTRTAAAQREDAEDAPATVVETVNYSLITPLAKQPQPSVSPAGGDSNAACRPADAVSAAPLLAHDRTRHEHRASNLEGKPTRDSTESKPTGSQSVDSRSAVNYSLVVALPPLPQQQQPPTQPSKLDEADDSCECTAKVQVTSLPSPDKANKKAALTVKKSVPNTYAYDLHKGSGASAAAPEGTQSAGATGEAAPALAARPIVRGSSRAGSSRVAAATERGIPPPVPPPPRDDMGLTAIDYSGDEPQFK